MAISLSNPASYGEGILLICIFLTSSLFGMTSFQGISYFRNFSHDPFHFKIMVASVMILSTFHICLCWSFMYHYFIVEFGNDLSLLVGPWTIKVTIPISCVSETICHLFFVTRIWILSGKNKLVCGSIVTLELVHFASDIAFTVKCFQAVYFTQLTSTPGTRRLFLVCLSASLAADLCITFSMCYCLHRSRTGHGRTDTVLSNLIVYSIKTGIITALGDAIVLVAYLALPNNVAFFSIFEVTIELYANAVLTSLNTRTELRSRLAVYNSTEGSSNRTPIQHLDLETLPLDSPGKQWSAGERYSEFPRKAAVPSGAVALSKPLKIHKGATCFIPMGQYPGHGAETLFGNNVDRT
ncbi:hypothetical protein SISSUDRAFT_1128225 [Sistotremastrum suecicum HHB10207 ss-3]|uniref:DUF6534 domain-containing protein n=1 Tax=Sistotremastrum suecicum HHB10207 ss-3 TaxID=1314776 RepID=A0A166E2U3_9AGAM|nr:hypothetical protein SISSUDRAFT_1128225 [Sistotremastrum suecicum HHB10207 ss-3]